MSYFENVHILLQESECLVINQQIILHKKKNDIGFPLLNWGLLCGAVLCVDLAQDFGTTGGVSGQFC